MTSIPLKYVAAIKAGQSPPSAEVHDLNGGLPFLQGNAEFGDTHPQPRYECATPPKVAYPGDILLSVRAPVGALNIADQSYGIGRGLCAITATQCDPRYLWWWLHTQRMHLDAVSTGSTYSAVTAEDIANLPFPTLPREEQRRIARFLDSEATRIDGLTEHVQRQLELLAERRQTLITAAVTGQYDVTSTATGE